MRSKRCLRHLIQFALACNLLLITSCIKEDYSECNMLRLHFKYDENVSDTDRLDSDVQRIKVFVFDATDVLYRIIDVNVDALKSGYYNINLPSGTYSFVTWAIYENNVSDNCYQFYEIANSFVDQFGDVRVGITTKFQLVAKLHTIDLPSEDDGEIAPYKSNIGDLFFANVGNTPIVANSSQVIEFSLIKNTNVIKFNITGLDNIETRSNSPFELFILAFNGCYNYDNSVEEKAREIRYSPYFESVVDNKLTMDFKILRIIIDEDLHSLSKKPISIHIIDKLSNKPLCASIDLLNSILQIKDANDNYLYKTQSDIDKEDVFVIDIDIDVNAAVTVSINGFKINDIEEDL